MKNIVAFLAVVAVAHAYVPRLDGRIVGGQQVDIRDYPYQVSVRIYDDHICGGTIVNANTILTACHCVHGMDHSLYSVRVGNAKHAQGTQHLVNEVIENPNFNPNTMVNDMAILKLSSSISFDSTAQPAALQPQDVEVAAGTIAWVSGWGALYEGDKVTPASLRAVDVAVVSNADCNIKYLGVIFPKMLCAQTLTHDACQGDSGGPLFANGKVIGVVSWGYGCAHPRYPGVYAQVSDMYSWIVANSY